MMNQTILFISLRSSVAFSPLFSPRNSNLFSIHKSSFSNSISNILYFSEARFKSASFSTNLLSNILVTAISIATTKYQHKINNGEKLLYNYSKSKAVIVYDCRFNKCSPKGAIYFNTLSCDLKIERVTFVNCTSRTPNSHQKGDVIKDRNGGNGGNGGAVEIESINNLRVQFVKAVDCNCDGYGKFLYSSNSLQSGANIENCDITASDNSKSGNGVFTIFQSHSNVYVSNINVSYNQNEKSGCSFQTVGNLVRLNFVSYINNSVHESDIIQFSAKNLIELEFADIIGNTIKSSTKLRKRSSLNDKRMSILSFESNDSVIISFVNFGNSFNYSEKLNNGKDSTVEVYYINPKSSLKLDLHFCAFDRISINESVLKINEELELRDEGSEYDPGEVNPHHNLWRGDDRDYDMLSKGISETYRASIAKSLVLSDHQLVNDCPTVTFVRQLDRPAKKATIIWTTFAVVVVMFIAAITTFVYFSARKTRKISTNIATIVDSIYDPQIIDDNALLHSS